MWVRLRTQVFAFTVGWDRIESAMKFHRQFAIPVLFAILLCCGSHVSAQEYKVESADVPVPAELSDAVRAKFSPQALRVSGANGLICEIWLLKSVIAGETPAQNADAKFNWIPQGTLVAAIRFPSDVKDYRRQSVKAGVYTLRYALSPVSANHQGVAPHRDFLLAIPATVDQDPTVITALQTIELARRSTTTNHPSVWCLMPGDGSGTSVTPASVTHDTENNFWIVNFSVSLYGGPGTGVGYPRMGLVVNGFGPEV
jgi:hypothetical protein